MGIPVNFTTDRASVFTSHEMEQFLLRYGVTHRVSSPYYPRANKRAEVTVKSGKRLILENISPLGSLNTDNVARALLAHHNQTDPITGLSPAEVIFGRGLRDHLPLQDHKFQPRAEWRLEADMREQAYAKRHILKKEQLLRNSKPLPELEVGDNVSIQDVANKGKAGKWTKTGVITEKLPFNSYEVKIDGSNKLTKRIRVHLRKIIPYVRQKFVQDEAFNKLPIIPSNVEPATTPDQTNETSSQSVTDPEEHNETTVGTSNPPRKKLKEKWIVAKKTKETLQDLPFIPRPNKPGKPHDYVKMKKDQEQARERIRLSKMDA